MATLGVLLLAHGRLLPLLLPIPVLWCFLSGLTLQTMGEPQAWALYGVLALVVAAWTWTIIRQRGPPHTRTADVLKENRT
jgi:hypothetical protein